MERTLSAAPGASAGLLRVPGAPREPEGPRDHLREPAGRTHRGALVWVAVGASLWGADTVLQRPLASSLTSIQIVLMEHLILTALRIISAAPLLAAAAWLRSPLAVASLEPRQWLRLVLLALVPGLAALLIYYRGLRHTRASLAAVAELCFPAAATVLNWAVLGVRISPAQVAGVALLWAVILSWERKS